MRSWGVLGPSALTLGAGGGGRGFPYGRDDLGEPLVELLRETEVLLLRVAVERDLEPQRTAVTGPEDADEAPRRHKRGDVLRRNVVEERPRIDLGSRSGAGQKRHNGPSFRVSQGSGGAGVTPSHSVVLTAFLAGPASAPSGIVTDGCRDPVAVS